VELSLRGENAIPSIMDAFGKAGGKPEIQGALAESVYRMAASAKTRATLDEMSKLTATTDVGERIENLAKEHRLSRS
jgi:hypothetical protein